MNETYHVRIVIHNPLWPKLEYTTVLIGIPRSDLVQMGPLFEQLVQDAETKLIKFLELQEAANEDSV
jgi:hypothetical protein